MRLKLVLCLLIAALMLASCTPRQDTSSELSMESPDVSAPESSIPEPETSEPVQPDYQVSVTTRLMIPEDEKLEQALVSGNGDYLLVILKDHTYYMRLVTPDGVILTEKTQGSKEPAFMIRRQYGFEQDGTKYSNRCYYDFDLQPADISIRGGMKDSSSPIGLKEIPSEIAETVPGGFTAIGCYEQYLTGYSPITYSTEHPSPPMFPENGSIGRYDTETGEIETVQLPVGCQPSEIVGDGRYYALFCTVNEENQSWLYENVPALAGTLLDSEFILAFDMESMTITGYYEMDGNFIALTPDGKQVCLKQNQSILRTDLHPVE